MKDLFSIVLLASFLLSVSAARLAGECAMMCNDIRTEVLTLEICRLGCHENVIFFTQSREAKRTLPRPKVGDFCSTAMEQGFSDACVALCMEQPPSQRVAQTCRAAAIEMPRPTVRRWCEHGYNVAFSKTVSELKNHFNPSKTAPQVEEATKTEPVHHTIPAAVHHEEKTTHIEDRSLVMTIPITLGEETHDLNVYAGETAEEAVVSFCQEHMTDDVSSCIRQLLDVVMERMAESGN